MDADDCPFVEPEQIMPFCGCEDCANLRRFALAALAEEAAIAKVPTAVPIDWRGVVDLLASDNPEESNKAERLLTDAINDPRKTLRSIHRVIALS